MGTLEALLAIVQDILVALFSAYFPSKANYQERHGQEQDSAGDPREEAETPSGSRNPFDVLDLPRDTTELTTVKKAFHKLARKFHPDKNIGREDDAKEKMQEINEAYAACLTSLGDESEDEGSQDETEAAGRGPTDDSAHAQSDDEAQWEEEEREFRRWRKMQKDQEKKLHREMQKSEKRQCREEEWKEKLDAVSTLKKREAAEALRKLGGKHRKNDSVECIQDQLRAALRASREAERERLERDKLHAEQAARAKAQKMKKQQLLYEIKKAGIPTSGLETRDELAELLRDHMDQQSAARSARLGKPRPVMDNCPDDWACAVRINAIDALFSRISSESSSTLCEQLDDDGNSLLHYCVYYSRRPMVEMIINLAGADWWRVCLVANFAGETAASLLSEHSQTEDGLGPWMNKLELQAKDAQIAAEVLKTERTVDVSALRETGLVLLCAWLVQQQLHSAVLSWDWAVTMLVVCVPVPPAVACTVLLAYRLDAIAMTLFAVRWTCSVIVDYSGVAAVIAAVYAVILFVLAIDRVERAREAYIDNFVCWTSRSREDAGRSFDLHTSMTIRRFMREIIVSHMIWLSTGFVFVAIVIASAVIYWPREINARVQCASRLRVIIAKVPILCLLCSPYMLKLSERVFTAKLLTFASFEISYSALSAVAAWYLATSTDAPADTSDSGSYVNIDTEEQEDKTTVESEEPGEPEVLQDDTPSEFLRAEMRPDRFVEIPHESISHDVAFTLSDSVATDSVTATTTVEPDAYTVASIMVVILLGSSFACFCLNIQWFNPMRILTPTGVGLRSCVGCATSCAATGLQQVFAAVRFMTIEVARRTILLACLPLHLAKAVVFFAANCMAKSLSICVTSLASAAALTVKGVNGVACALKAVADSVRGGASLLCAVPSWLCLSILSSCSCRCSRATDSHADGASGCVDRDSTIIADDESAMAYAKVSEFLASQGYSRYLQVFIENEVTLSALLRFTEADLKELGVAKGPRVKILATLQTFDQEAPASPSANPTTRRRRLSDPVTPVSEARATRHAADAAADRSSGSSSADDDDDNTLNVLMVKEREANQKLLDNRSAALRAREQGFPIPVRRVGDIDCESRRVKLHASVPVEGEFPDRPGRSALQDLVIDGTWHPVRKRLLCCFLMLFLRFKLSRACLSKPSSAFTATCMKPQSSSQRCCCFLPLRCGSLRMRMVSRKRSSTRGKKTSFLRHFYYSECLPRQARDKHREISKKRARFFRSDPKLVAMERAYPGLSVADFIVGVWQELQRYNSSGGYTVEIPWHAKLERELTPVEVTEILMRGKGGKASKKKRR